MLSTRIRPRSYPFNVLTNLCWGILASLSPSPSILTPIASALAFSTGRASGGYSFLAGDKGKSSSTATVSATGRFGYMWDEDKYFAAIDVNAYRFLKNKNFKVHQDGNNILGVFGVEYSRSSFWLAAGAGELRSYDRVSETSRPYRYFVLEQQLGCSFQLYSADYARVELGLSLDRMAPEGEWRTKTGIASMNSLQIDIGFKLLNW